MTILSFRVKGNCLLVFSYYLSFSCHAARIMIRLLEPLPLSFPADCAASFDSGAADLSARRPSVSPLNFFPNFFSQF